MHRISAFLLAVLVVGWLSVGFARADMPFTLTRTANTETDLAGYKVYQGTVSGVYGPPTDVKNVTTFSGVLPSLSVDQRYYFAITAYDTMGYADQYVSAGCNDYVRKPVSIRGMLNLINGYR